MAVYSKEDLKGLQPEHATLVAIDSDGCVLPTMEIKQKECFHPLIIEHWQLEAIARYVREVAEFVNLYSCWRGTNRFVALVKTFDLLRERAEVRAAGVAVPRLDSLRGYIAAGGRLSNEGLSQEVERTGDAELRSVLQWSLAVNEAIERKVKGVGPCEWARRAIERIARDSDLIVVSQTPEDALLREWREHGLDGYVRVIAGQELGTKAEQLELAVSSKYDSHSVLVVGDAPGDLAAARSVGASFYPIMPGDEERSWELLCCEAYDKFLAGEYHGDYEQRLVQLFEALLPSEPPWAR